MTRSSLLVATVVGLNALHSHAFSQVGPHKARTLSFQSLSTFLPTSSSSRSTTTSSHASLLKAASSSSDDIILSEKSMITPKGFGFTATMERILKETKMPFHKAQATDKVMSVMQAMQNNGNEVALVFQDDEQLVGIFTETDYIRFSVARSKVSNNEEEAAQFLVDATVADYCTTRENLITLSSTDTANTAMAAMKDAGVRHLVIMNSNNDKAVAGVVSMRDVMSVIQQDERLSLTNFLARSSSSSPYEDMLKQELASTANRMASNEETEEQDVVRSGATAALLAAFVIAFSSQSPWLHDHADLAMIAIFILGYVGIIFEEVFEFNKAGVALLMSTGLWITYADYYQNSLGTATSNVLSQLGEQLSEVSEICFFLLAASAIVEVVDAHQGFKVVTDNIKTSSKKELFWVIGFITFFLSSILNNLTVTIVMVSLLRKLVPNDEDRRLFGAMVVVAANAGGVWTPIGDVTTTMLWINNQLSTIPTIVELFVPSVVCLVASLAFLVNQVEEDDTKNDSGALSPVDTTPLSKRGQVVFWSGIVSLLAVPVFTELTGLPPYLAMLTGLGLIWTLTDVIHMGESSPELKVPAALQKLDTAGILFFLGILMSIGVLDKSGLLKELAVFLSDTLPSLDIIATVIGLASALIDNVPLVAATMGMYDLADYGTDDKLWQLIALCAGTGGSILVIGSASGVALMGLEKVDFLWYAKKVTIGATVGYFAGIATYLLQYAVMNGGGLGSLLPQAAVAADMIQQAVIM